MTLAVIAPGGGFVEVSRKVRNTGHAGVTGELSQTAKEGTIPRMKDNRPGKSRAALRSLAVRKVVAMYRNNPDKDWKETGFELLNDPDLKAYWEGRSCDECEDLVMGLVRFGERSRGGDSR